MYNIAVLGTGYIGIVIGICLADFGHKVIFADIDKEKIAKLNNNEIPIFEPGVKELLAKIVKSNSVQFTDNIAEAIKASSIIFIAVNTPMGTDGKADIGAVKKTAEMIGQNLNENKIVCIKSTVPIGIHKIVDEIIKLNNKKYECDIVSVPEFLREGTAIRDFMNPDRIIIGTKSAKSYKILKDILSSTNCDTSKIIWTDNLSAETIKYVSNSFLALKVSFINEIANFCDEIGVDIASVAHGVGLDHRIGNQFLKPGPGFGGSCFPKDVLALLKMSQDVGNELQLIKATLNVNDLQKKHVIRKLKKLFNNNLAGKTIAVWGLAFKANTDDIRYSPAIDIINELLNEKVFIKAHDPKAIKNTKEVIPNIIYYDDAYQAATNADAILLLTEWPQFTKLDFNKIYDLLNQKIIFDTRNILNFEELKSLGFIVESIGRSVASNSQKLAANHHKFYSSPSI